MVEYGIAIILGCLALAGIVIGRRTQQTIAIRLTFAWMYAAVAVFSVSILLHRLRPGVAPKGTMWAVFWNHSEHLLTGMGIGASVAALLVYYGEKRHNGFNA